MHNDELNNLLRQLTEELREQNRLKREEQAALDRLHAESEERMKKLTESFGLGNPEERLKRLESPKLIYDAAQREAKIARDEQRRFQSEILAELSRIKELLERKD
jgi:hypothetical protein